MPNRSFSGEPTTIWLTESGPDRRMRLIDGFWFDDRRGTRWSAAAGTVVDGASIPRSLWALVGSPYTGDYRRASIVHDVACVDAGNDLSKRKSADKMFYEACREGGCSVFEAIILYIGVRIGAAWGSALMVSEQGVRIQETQLDVQIRRDFQELAQDVLRTSPPDDADEIERRVDDAAEKLVARRALLTTAALI